MLGRSHFRIDSFNASSWIDQVGDSAGRLRFEIITGAVGEPDLPVGIAEKRKPEVELARERRVFVRRVEADAKDLAVLLGKLGSEIAEPATFGGSPGSVRLWIEPEQNVPAPQLGERERGSLVGQDGEVGRDISNRKHGASLPGSGESACRPNGALRIRPVSHRARLVAPEQE
jgi:hypothetical protein